MKKKSRQHYIYLISKQGGNQKIFEPSDYSEVAFIEDDIILYKRNRDEEKEVDIYTFHILY